jgi:hypothetical protein
MPLVHSENDVPHFAAAVNISLFDLYEGEEGDFNFPSADASSSSSHPFPSQHHHNHQQHNGDDAAINSSSGPMPDLVPVVPAGHYHQQATPPASFHATPPQIRSLDHLHHHGGGGVGLHHPYPPHSEHHHNNHHLQQQQPQVQDDVEEDALKGRKRKLDADSDCSKLAVEDGSKRRMSGMTFRR